jgi:hypothetical protein
MTMPSVRGFLVLAKMRVGFSMSLRARYLLIGGVALATAVGVARGGPISDFRITAGRAHRSATTRIITRLPYTRSRSHRCRLTKAPRAPRSGPASVPTRWQRQRLSDATAVRSNAGSWDVTRLRGTGQLRLGGRGRALAGAGPGCGWRAYATIPPLQRFGRSRG